MRRVCNSDNRGTQCCGEGVCEGDRVPDWRDVVVRAATLNVKLQVCANSDQIQKPKRHPVPQRPASAEESVGRNALPPTDLLGRALTKTHLVAVIPAAFGGVARVFPVDSGFEQYLGKGHV